MSNQQTFEAASSGSLDIAFIQGDSGTPAGPDATGKVTFLGVGGLTFVSDAATNRVTGTISGSGLSWNNTTGTTQTMVGNNGYYANNAALVVFTLPFPSVFGQTVAVVGWGAGGWKINQSAGQSIRVGANVSTVGIGGSMSSVNQYDSLMITCGPDNLTWTSVGAPQTSGLTPV